VVVIEKFKVQPVMSAKPVTVKPVAVKKQPLNNNKTKPDVKKPKNIMVKKPLITNDY
jgi:hypothetical protein